MVILLLQANNDAAVVAPGARPSQSPAADAPRLSQSQEKAPRQRSSHLGAENRARVPAREIEALPLPWKCGTQILEP